MRAAVQSILRRFNLALTRYDTTIPARRVRLLRYTGCIVVLDVGANAGQYAANLRTHGYTGRIHSFEPVSAPYSELERRAARDASWSSHKVAVGSASGVLAMNVSASTLFSSALPILETGARSEPQSRFVSREDVRVETLDGLVREHVHGDSRMALKVDVQGLETEVLRGAAQTLPRVAFLEVELSLVPVYQGEEPFREMLDRILGLGFELAVTEPVFPDYASGRSLQLNGLFIRPPH